MTCGTDDIVRLTAQPTDYLDYGHDLTTWLAETTTGDTLTGVTVEAIPPAAATIDNANVVDAGRQVVAWITATADVRILFHITTTQGRQITRITDISVVTP